MLDPVRLLARLAACGLVPVGVATAQPPRMPVERFAPLLLAALHARDGNAHGVLTGDLAAAIGRRYATTAPIEIDVSTIARHAQQGCARLRVDVSQRDVKFSATAAPQRQEIRFELNYCTDGLPPRGLAVGGAQ